MKSLATWCVRHRVIVVLLWLAALIGMTVISQSVGTAYSNSFTLPNTESTQALDLLQAAAPQHGRRPEQIVFHTTDGTKVTDPAGAGHRQHHAGQGREVPHVTTIASPYSGRSAPTRSAPTADRVRHRHLRPSRPQNISTPEAKQFVATAQTASGPNLQVAVAGSGRRSGRQAVLRRHRARASSWPPSCCSWCSARSSPWPCPCCRPWPRWARPSA